MIREDLVPISALKSLLKDQSSIADDIQRHTMPDLWLSLKRSLCKLQPSEVHDPRGRRRQRDTQRKDFVPGSKSRPDKPRSHSPKSKGNGDILNPITHEIVLDNSNSKTEMCSCCPCPSGDTGGKAVERPHKSRRPVTPKSNHVECSECDGSSSRKVNLQADSDDPSALICNECGEKLKRLDAVEAHNISEHSVTGLSDQDSSWHIIEAICKTSQTNSENNSGQIESVLKVLNMPKTLSCFENYREMVKINAKNLLTKHPRCLADGYELLRFHGTTVACSLGINGFSSLCNLEHCGICQILRNGFSLTEKFHGKLGVFVTATCEKAFESVGITEEKPSLRKSVIVCRVIAGRVHNLLEEIQEIDDNGFDSLAENVSSNLDVEELFVLNPRALLPCFVVIYRS